MAGAQSEGERRILLVGKTGAGKSATGNSLLGRDEFHSSVRLSSVTTACERQEANWEGRRILVVDTPGFFDHKNRKFFTRKDVESCIRLLLPGPHAILVVIKPGTMTEEANGSIRKVKEFFSREGKSFLILLFTHKDQLDNKGITLKQFLGQADGDLKELIDMAENRCIAINNCAKEEERSKQVAEVMAMIDNLVSHNGGRRPHYTKELFEKDRLSWCPLL